MAGQSLAEPITIRMMSATQGIPPPSATDPRSLARRAIFDEFHRLNPDIRVVNAGGLELQGERAESGFLMSMAGDTAPDVFYVNFRQYYNYIDQGFCRPLDDLMAKNPAVRERINPLILKVLESYDNKVYAIPFYQVAQGLYYRKDHFLQAGLDPNSPPRTWDEFIAVGRKLIEADPTRAAFSFSGSPQGQAYYWINFLWQAGGEVVQPAEGGLWKATIATPAGVKALEFYRRLTVEKWVGKDGKTYGPIAQVAATHGLDINNGKVSMWFDYTNDIVLNIKDINPSLLGMARMPAGPAGSFNEINAGMWGLNAQMTDPRKVEACWRFIEFYASQAAAKVNTDKFVDLGLANLINPVLLKKFGYADLAATVDPLYIKANEELFQTGKPEPYGRNCQQVYTVLDSALEQARLYPKADAMSILTSVQQEMDRKLLGYTPKEELARQRGWAAGILITVLVLVTGIVIWAIRRARKNPEVIPTKLPAGSDRGRVTRFITLCLLPASLSILVWSYYPLLRGLVIAFQDYRIVQGSKWVGLDNFISVFTQPIFWKALTNSFVYVGLTIVIGFMLPIFLALSLNEIPRFKVLFRTVFYLPAMTSPIVIAFLWRQFYDKSEQGILNSLVSIPIGWWNSLFGTQIPPATYDWLGDPSLAMLAVVLPGIWAGAGPGSILYLAALKNIPEERYEAADLDGASWITKIRYITLPGLKPLVLINLLGVFIGGFKAMENIFVLTGGGPLYSTHVIGLEVWTNAFMFLKFGYATAAAWVMGSILIGFTVIQIRSLTRMKFSTVKV